MKRHASITAIQANKPGTNEKTIASLFQAIFTLFGSFPLKTEELWNIACSKVFEILEMYIDSANNPCHTSVCVFCIMDSYSNIWSAFQLVVSFVEQEVLKLYKMNKPKHSRSSAGTSTENMLLVVMAFGWVPTLDQNRRNKKGRNCLWPVQRG